MNLSISLVNSVFFFFFFFGAQDAATLCTCKIDPNKGQFTYAGTTCNEKVYPVPSYKLDDSTVLDGKKIMTPGTPLILGYCLDTAWILLGYCLDTA